MSSQEDEGKIYKIGQAASMLDVKTSVLRFWEGEFDQLEPIRTSSGQRLYNEEHIIVLKRIKELLYDEGLTIDGARKKLESGFDREVSSTEWGDSRMSDLPLFGHGIRESENADTRKKLLLHVRDELLYIKSMLD